MNARLCPSCSSLVESESALFCYNCGSELIPAGHLEKSDSPKKLTAVVPEPRQGSFPLWVLAVLLLVLFVSMSFYLAKKNLLSAVPPATKATPKNLADEFTSTASALPIAPYDLKDVEFGKLVPAEASLFLQSRLPSLILGKMLSTSQKEEFGQKTGLTLTEAVSFLGDDYGFAQLPKGFLFLFKVKDESFIKTKLSEFPKEVLRGEMVGDTLAVSNSGTIIEAVKAVSQEKQLSLSQTNDFAEGRRRLGPGQLFLYFKDRSLAQQTLRLIFGNGFLGDGLALLKGNAYVVDSVSGSARLVGVYGKE